MPGDTDSVRLQHWLLRFSVASGELRLIVADLAEWLVNGRPSWAAYRALMSGRLITLEKNPGVSPVGFGKPLRRLMANYVLRLKGQEAKATCGTEQIAGDV